MSSSIWMQCAGDSEIAPLQVDAWRAVESQHQISTRKLVDSDAEQLTLEDLIETSKPPTRGRRLQIHYLLATPFRYPPLRHGSRFARRTEMSLWYGAEQQRTVFAEVAYYRFLFLDGTSADLGRVDTQLTVFQAQVRTKTGVDLAKPPFDAHRDAIIDPFSYSETQPLGTSMRDAGVAAFRFPSARDPLHGNNIGVFAPEAFGARKPRKLESWQCFADRNRVELTRRDYFHRAAWEFPREVFLQSGIFPVVRG